MPGMSGWPAHKAIAYLLDKGWKIERTSCTCGGNWAWLKPRPSGAMEMAGCVCHNDLNDLATNAGMEKKRKE